MKVLRQEFVQKAVGKPVWLGEEQTLLPKEVGRSSSYRACEANRHVYYESDGKPEESHKPKSDLLLYSSKRICLDALRIAVKVANGETL